ncbi:MAG TPA: sigma-70 family RNA polymerase sigma factor [Planctomycetota bacterium]
MSRTAKLVSGLCRAGRVDEVDLARAVATVRRRRMLEPQLRKLLADSDLPFLPEVREDAFRDRRATSSASAAGHSLRVYWADLRRIRPTTRADEFLLARAIGLLRASLLDLLGAAPGPAVRALATEHLGPWSSVRAALEERPHAPAKRFRQCRARLARLQRRLLDLQRLQNVLVARNMHLVPAAARRYLQVGVPWEDLIQEGNTALLRAVERFNPDANVRFSHYAGWWIQQGILKALSCQSRTVRLPVYLAQAVHRVRGVCAASPVPLEIPEIARRTGVSADRVARALEADRACSSLDRLSNSDAGGEDNAPTEWLADPREESGYEDVEPGRLRRALETQLARLPEREALVLTLRFGLDGKEPRTLDQVRSVLGVSRERVRQLQTQSLRRLARPLGREDLARFL